MEKDAGVSTPTWPKAQNPASPPTAALLWIWFFTFEIQNTDRRFHTDFSIAKFEISSRFYSNYLIEICCRPIRSEIQISNLKSFLIAFHKTQLAVFHKFVFHCCQYKKFLDHLFQCKLHDDDQLVKWSLVLPEYPSYGQKCCFVLHHLQWKIRARKCCSRQHREQWRHWFDEWLKIDYLHDG